ncbi:unnamed protein product [Brassica oleracea]|uniref:(rape) hypothetical protein n=1 Tax=Brassica napus TaxID=3708 RepID=A0A816LCS5_BRANA|nr:unnamed protein product [Brassica napus]
MVDRLRLFTSSSPFLLSAPLTHSSQKHPDAQLSIRKNFYGDSEIEETIREMEATEERLVVYDVDVLDYQSILVSLKTSNAVFCLLDSPEGYDEKEVDLEVRGAINVVEACERTESIDKIVFSSSSLTASILRDNIGTQKDVDEKCWSDQDFCRNKKFAEGMVEFIGLLEVAVKKGTNLAIRDMMSSDAYVALNLGKQVTIVHKLQKTVVNCNLNPVWNQELMLSVPDSYGPVKLQVYDYDTFSAGDIMGEAQLDIQPLITSAMVFGDPEMFGDMQIGKWLKLHDNPPIDDSII